LSVTGRFDLADYEWSAAKEDVNLAKHGLDFSRCLPDFRTPNPSAPRCPREARDRVSGDWRDGGHGTVCGFHDPGPQMPIDIGTAGIRG
jgi:uncharacterized DUF497 family protein